MAPIFISSIPITRFPKIRDIVATTTDYGGEFASSVSRGNLFACQFHPEKSQTVGLKILHNFGALVQP